MEETVYVRTTGFDIDDVRYALAEDGYYRTKEEAEAANYWLEGDKDRIIEVTIKIVREPLTD